MGSGYRDFTPGEQLTADIMDGYLMRQTVMTFASSTARDTALSGVLDEGMVTYLEDTNELTYYTGAAWRTIYKPRTTHVPVGSGAVSTGNGTYSADYWRAGDTVHYRGRFTLGSSSAISTGTLTFSLPVTADLTVADTLGSAFLYDSDANQNYSAFASLGSTTTLTVSRMTDGVAGAVGSSNPFTWATGDLVTWNLAYLAA